MADRRAATAETVVQLVSQVERRPSRERAAEEPGTGRVLTIAALAEASSRLANAFIGLGLQRGQRVAYVAQNHLEYLVLEFALAKAGLVKVPLNFRFAPQELRRCLELADVRLVLADDASAGILEEVFGDSGPLRVMIGRTGRMDLLRGPRHRRLRHQGPGPGGTR